MALSKDSVLVSPQYAETVVNLLVSEKLSLASNTNKTYSLNTLLDTKVAEYNLASVSVELLVLDSVTGSTTINYYIPADAVAIVGIKEDGSVLIRNTFDTTLNFLVRITVRRKNTPVTP